ncbi:MAG: membrane dipeptidase [Proteobacteria bacterium]|nr:membrane dipeptidase [Pseudomonadota bacterium]
MPANAPVKLRADQRAIDFTNKTLVFDCLALYYVLEDRYAERCLAGGVNASNITFAAEASWDETLRKTEIGLRRIETSPYLMLATRAADILKAKESGKLAIIPGTQGGSMIEKELARVGILARLGFRFIGPAYTGGTLFCDGCGETRNGGFTFLGREFIAAVNETPMILDLSHSSHRARDEAAELARAPVCTHSNAWDFVPNDRNTKDSTARALVAKGGMVGLCGLPKTVKPKNPTLDDLIDHCDHYKRVIGAANIGIGLDFTEGYKAAGQILDESRRWRTYRPDIFGTVDEFLTQSYPEGISTIVEFPNITHALFARGYGEAEVAGILGGNWFRTFQKFAG